MVIGNGPGDIGVDGQRRGGVVVGRVFRVGPGFIGRTLLNLDLSTEKREKNLVKISEQNSPIVVLIGNVTKREKACFVLPLPNSVDAWFLFDKRPPDVLPRFEAVDRLLGLDGGSGIILSSNPAQTSERLDPLQIHDVDEHVGHRVGSTNLKLKKKHRKIVIPFKIVDFSKKVKVRAEQKSRFLLHLRNLCIVTKKGICIRRYELLFTEGSQWPRFPMPGDNAFN